MNLDKAYRPQEHEAEIYRRWEEAGTFALDETKTDQKPFVVALPPPNANADIHLGYALDVSLKDVLARWHRLRGRPVLVIPGADHAGFETWIVYERHLNDQGKSRFDFERNDLYRQVYDFVVKNMGNMKDQIRRLGASCDWQEFNFTLDKKIVDRSYETFRAMWSQDLIYREKRLVNFCVHHGTGFSDFEVQHKEVMGKLYYIRYPLADDASQTVIIATTRPETLLGDVAVAVNPEDGRYASFINRKLKLPLTERTIPVIADEEVVADFGSGALKITPGHDFVDFEIGRRAKLKPIEIIDKKGLITGQAPAEFTGLTVAEARKRVLQRLKEEGHLEKTEDYRHQVGHCYKCGTVLEPLLASQWFVRMQPLAQAAITELRKGKIKFYPQSKLQELITYLGQLKDWNISRQIVWGISIPVFQNQDNPSDWIFDQRVDKEILTKDGKTYRRDPDVFDTWWSSGQWPFATVDWPERPALYPNSLMETGVDILKPWVSRMIVLGLFVTGKLPFETVYLHGMITDGKGVKMSKSKGNAVNPLTMIDQYGADALRIGLCCQVAPAQNQKFGTEKIVLGRNFCNKLWNIGRFLQNNPLVEGTADDSPSLQSPADIWIWNRFLKAKESADADLTDYQIATAWDTMYAFVWNDLADWYLETCKWRLNRPFLQFLFAQCLRLLHPFAPFLTENLFQQLGDGGKNLLINSAWTDWPAGLASPDAAKVEHFERLKDLISKTRQLLPYELRKRGQLLVRNPALFDDDLNSLCQQLAGVDNMEMSERAETGTLPVSQTEGYEAWIRLDPQLLKDQLRKLETEAEELDRLGKALDKRLKNSDYLAKAPRHLVEESEQQQKDLRLKKAVLAEEISRFRTAL